MHHLHAYERKLNVIITCTEHMETYSNAFGACSSRHITKAQLYNAHTSTVTYHSNNVSTFCCLRTKSNTGRGIWSFSALRRIN